MILQLRGNEALREEADPSSLLSLGSRNAFLGYMRCAGLELLEGLQYRVRKCTIKKKQHVESSADLKQAGQTLKKMENGLQ